MDDLVLLEVRIAEIDEPLKRIATAPVDLSDPKWMEKLQKSVPIDVVGKRAEAEAALSDAVDAYDTGDEATRAEIRAMFTRYPSFVWGAPPPWPKDTAEGLTKRLLLFSIVDQGKDTRDALMQLHELVAAAKAARVDTARACRHAASRSSDVDRYGMGSTRSMLLKA